MIEFSNDWLWSRVRELGGLARISEDPKILQALFNEIIEHGGNAPEAE